MIFIIILIVVAFLYWSLVPAKPKQPTFNDIINASQKQQGNYSNVYRSDTTKKIVGYSMYYEAKSPIDPSDTKVFTGTINECLQYVAKHSHNRFWLSIFIFKELIY